MFILLITKNLKKLEIATDITMPTAPSPTILIAPVSAMSTILVSAVPLAPTSAVPTVLAYDIPTIPVSAIPTTLIPIGPGMISFSSLHGFLIPHFIFSSRSNSYCPFSV